MRSDYSSTMRSPRAPERVSAPFPQNVMIYRAKRTLSWPAVFGVSGLLMVLGLMVCAIILIT